MRDGIQDVAVANAVRGGAKDALGKDGAVDGGIRGGDEVWSGGEEVGEDLGVAAGAGGDDLVREKVGVD